MKKFFLGTVGIFAISGAMSQEIQHTQRPNIVFFMVDDMGWQDCSYPFWKEKTLNNQMFRTPNLERLAKQGVAFTRAYASAVSSPSRVSLMTGMNPAAHKVVNWTLYQDTPPDKPSDVLNFPRWNWNGLQPRGANIPQSVEATPLVEVLRTNGYHTIHVGKAHFGSIGTPGADPRNLGFDVNIAGHAAGGLASYLGEQNYGNRTDGNASSPFAVPDLEKYWGTDTFVTEALTIEALKALDSARTLGKPFFLYLSHYAIHVPLDKDERFYQKYIDAGVPDELARYAALIEGMDKSLGDLMDYLEKNNLAKNTIIVFMSDNGGLSATREPHPDLGNRHNHPLNSGKGSPYEGGVRVPLVISVPNMGDHNTRSQAIVEICDMYPTLLSMAGIKQSSAKIRQTLDGQDITPYIEGRLQTIDRAIYWHYPTRWDAEGPGIGTYSSILKGNWKLIYYYDTQKSELYNIHSDICEVVDQSRNPALAERRAILADQLTSYLKKHGAQLPLYKSGTPMLYPNGERYHPKKKLTGRVFPKIED